MRSDYCNNYVCVVKYSPLIDGKLDAGVSAVGQVGVWRLVNSEYDNTDTTLKKQLAALEQPFQPELEKFIVTDICNG